MVLAAQSALSFGNVGHPTIGAECERIVRRIFLLKWARGLLHGSAWRQGRQPIMSPRNFWNHPLQELARSLAHTIGRQDQGDWSTDEFAAFLGRLVGTAAQGPGLTPQPIQRPVSDCRIPSKGLR